MKLKDIRSELENFDYCEIIYNLSSSGCTRYEQEYEYVYQLLNYPDDYEIPYKCYEVLYDWDDFGYGDGHDAVCFYSEEKGYLQQNPRANRVYGKKEEN